MAAQYKLRALSIFIGGKLFKKEDGYLFSEENTEKTVLENAVKSGYLEEVVSEVKKPVKEKKEE